MTTPCMLLLGILASLPLPRAVDPPAMGERRVETPRVRGADERLALQLTSFQMVPDGTWSKLPPGDPGWAEAVDSVLAETRKVHIDGPSSGTIMSLPLTPPAAQAANELRAPRTDATARRDEATTRLAAMVDCYRRELGRSPAPRTGVELRMRVTTKGTVSEALLTRFQPGRGGVEACIVEATKAWAFPKSFREQRVRVRFAFPMGFNR
jgi:hypothetical protein